MKRVISGLYAILLTAGAGFAGISGCGEQPASDLQIERLPEVNPNLPPVPQIPEPPFPIRNADNTYTVFGLRNKIRQTIDTEVSVTAYIVDIYEPPECPEGETCPRPTAPHMWIADTEGESDDAKKMAVAGYAENHEELEEAIRRRRPQRSQDGEITIPTDFAVGNRVKVTGRFVRVSGSGFNYSEGLIEYAGHETL